MTRHFLQHKVFLSLLVAVLLVLILINLAGVFPARATVSSSVNVATNPQMAAIFGAQNLLLHQQPIQVRYLPVIIR